MTTMASWQSLFKDEPVAQGWKPGAVSRCLLRKLNKAKRHTSAVTSHTKLKRSKRKSVDKPMLIISKKEGQYNVEMQVTPEQNGSEQYKPVVYKIASANNEEKVRRRERKARRLTKKIVDGWSDPYHPEICETTCFRAYMESYGYFDFDDVPEQNELEEESHEGSCGEDDSDDSSLDVDWEIHFSPPVLRHKAEGSPDEPT